MVDCFELNEREPCPYKQFAVVELNQISELTDEVNEHLSNVIQSVRFEPTFLAAIAEDLGWHDVQDLIISQGIPRTGTISRGDFGEALLDWILERYHEYVIPVKKLRFKITAGQSLPGTDALALKLDSNNTICEVCYIESKLRTVSDNAVAVDGHNQLCADYESKLPDILTFIAYRLFEREDPLFAAFRAYLRTRRDTAEDDTFRLGLFFDSTQWNERVLENLEANEVKLPELTAHVIRIHNLKEVTEEILTNLGASEIIEDD